VLALVMLQAGSLTRYVRASMLDVVKMDFIRTARAKGCSERTVILKHAATPCCRSPCWASSCRGCSPGRSLPKRYSTGRGIHIDSLAARDYPVLMGLPCFWRC
jgi:peptide/nickel transport system permease protein